METTESTIMNCAIYGIGAWGPGFNTWAELASRLREKDTAEHPPTTAPKPEIIPPNERRRSPLPVKIAIETSWQALQAANIPATELSCVFGSGLGDTEITDYMCRTLASEQKQLSPTKFHNSVHNAAAGYWTISTDCMKAANSVAAYHNTAGLALLEGASQCLYQNEPVLITLFDTAAHNVYREIFPCSEPFSAALILAPDDLRPARTWQQKSHTLSLSVKYGNQQQPQLMNPQLEDLRQQNPAAKILSLLEPISHTGAGETTLNLSESTYLSIALNTASPNHSIKGHTPDSHGEAKN